MFASERDGGTQHLYQKRSDGVGSDERLLESNNDTMVPLSWAPDGNTIVYAGGPVNIGLLPLGGEGAPHPFETSPQQGAQAYPEVSPDGRWLAYTSTESGRPEIYVQSFPSPGGGKWQVSKDGGAYSRWRRDGKELFYLAADRRLMSVEVKWGAGFEAGVPKALFEAPIPAEQLTRYHYAVTADGQRFLIIKSVGEVSAQPLTVVVNWTADLKR